jgi:manganese/zinc/iron transport system substrate-binding protein
MSKNRSRPLALLMLPALLGLLALAACGKGRAGSPSGKEPIHIVATTGIVADTAARIAGEHARIEALMGPGVDPHLFKASESDVRRLAEADLVLYNGLHLEGKMGDILTKMARSRPVVAVTESIPESERREPPEFLGQYDPHVWFDVSLWAHTLDPIVEELAKLAPDHAAEFRSNAESYRRELLALDAEVKERIQQIPAPKRVLVTAHDAFGYFGQRYGMEVVGLQGISTLSEAGLQDVQRVVDLVTTRAIPAIFVESSVPRRSIEAVQAAVRSRGHRVVIGGQLYSDSLGAAGSPAGTYTGMVRANVETMVRSLSADPSNGGTGEEKPR